MEELGLKACIVGKHQFWTIINIVVPEDIKNSLGRKVSKQLFYVGLDLKEHGISDSILENLASLGIGSELTEVIIPNEMKVSVRPALQKPNLVAAGTVSHEGSHPLYEGMSQSPIKALQQVEDLPKMEVFSQGQSIIVGSEHKKSSDYKIESGTVVPVKRGRGRPRKEKVVVDTPVQTINTIVDVNQNSSLEEF